MIQKLTPEGKLLWTWNSKDHIGLAETGRWSPELDEPYDLVHINAIEPTNSGNDYLISLRHTDAVYRLDGVTSDVEWKLGGEQGRSLQVQTTRPATIPSAANTTSASSPTARSRSTTMRPGSAMRPAPSVTGSDQE